LISEGKFTPMMNEIISKKYGVVGFHIWKEFETEEFNRRKKTETYIQKIASELKLKFAQYENITPPRFKIGVITGLSSELKPFLKRLENPQILISNNNSFNTGVITKDDGSKVSIVAVNQEEMGVEDAAILGTILKERFNIEFLIMIGVCGGREGFAEIGELVIPSETVAYQRGKLNKDGFSLDVGYQKTQYSVRQTFKETENILLEHYETFMSENIKKGSKQLPVSPPKINFDQMACGAQVVDFENFLDGIADNTAKRKLCSVDLESFAIYRLGHLLNFNTIVLKSVMDLASNKNDQYKEYASYLSANYLYSVIKKGVLQSS